MKIIESIKKYYYLWRILRTYKKLMLNYRWDRWNLDNGETCLTDISGDLLHIAEEIVLGPSDIGYIDDYWKTLKEFWEL